jgi:hypothetical protein
MAVMAAPTTSAASASAACERFTEIARHHNRQNMEDRFIGSSVHRIIGSSAHRVIWRFSNLTRGRSSHSNTILSSISK